LRNNLTRLLRVVLRLAVACVMPLYAVACSATPSHPNAMASMPAAASPTNPSFDSFYRRYNSYRKSAGLPAVKSDPGLSEGAKQHCIYLVKNRISGGDAGIADGHLSLLPFAPSVHAEASDNRYFSAAGANAAKWSFIVRGSSLPADTAPLVDDAMTIPFGAMWVLNPQTAALGYGEYCDHNECAAVVTFRMGLPRDEFLQLFDVPATFWNPAQGNVPWEREPLRRPIEFPPPNSQIGLTSSAGIPAPITSCPGLRNSAGLPITLLLGAPATGDRNQPVTATNAQLMDNGTPANVCLLDETELRSSNPRLEGSGRYQLHMLGAVILVPEKPLTPGHNYRVTIVADGEPYEWGFGVTPQAAAERSGRSK